MSVNPTGMSPPKFGKFSIFLLFSTSFWQSESIIPLCWLNIQGRIQEFAMWGRGAQTLFKKKSAGAQAPTQSGGALVVGWFVPVMADCSWPHKFDALMTIFSKSITIMERESDSWSYLVNPSRLRSSFPSLSFNHALHYNLFQIVASCNMTEVA